MRLKKIMLAGVSLLALAVGASEAMAANFGYTGTEDFYTIPVSGIYDVTVAGAQGGGNPAAPGGLGAIVHGNVFLTGGTLLDIFVGGIAGPSAHGAGGGGGSFVLLDNPVSPLAIGGGGGGAGGYLGASGAPGGPGQAGTAGQKGFGFHGGGGGTGGNGGGGGTNSAPGGGGTGFNSGGGDGTASGIEGFGGHFPDGGVGDAGNNDGGFGGGGGGGNYGGGGGGGYSGGGGGDGSFTTTGSYYGGGGGGSFLAPEFTNTRLTGGANHGYGYVTINPVPEPGTLPVLGSALLALGLWRRRRS